MELFKHNSSSAKTLAVLLLVAVFASSFAFLALPKKAEAVVAIACFVPLDFQCIKNATLDLLARIITTTVIRAVTNSIIAWIQGDGGANVGFVQNFEQEFRRQIDLRGGEFLEQLTGINLCGDIGAFLQISLRTSTSRQEQFACTVTDIVENIDDFFNDFSQGGWPAFIRITHDHQNNPSGAFIIAFDAKAQAEGEAMGALITNLLSNNGVKGVQKATKAKCEGDETGTLRCQTEYLIKTPGRLVMDMLQEAGLSGLKYAYVADEIDEAISSIVGALIQKIIGSVTDGIFNSELSNMSEDNGRRDPGGGLAIISPTNLTKGSVNTPYFEQLEAMGGVPPYEWEVVEGTLPPGLSLSPSGIISGTPSEAGIFSALVRVTDDVENSAIWQIIIDIDAEVTAPPPSGGSPPAA